MPTLNVIDKAVSETWNAWEYAYDDAGSLYPSVTCKVSEWEARYSFRGACHGNDDEGYDLDDVNMAIAGGMADALAHQRGEIALPDIDDAFRALRNEI